MMAKLCLIDFPVLFPAKRGRIVWYNPRAMSSSPLNLGTPFANMTKIHGEQSKRGRKSMLANDSLGRYQSLETAFKPDTRGMRIAR